MKKKVERPKGLCQSFGRTNNTDPQVDQPASAVGLRFEANGSFNLGNIKVPSRLNMTSATGTPGNNPSGAL